MNIPNILTVMRFFIVPFFCYFMVIEQYHTAVILFVLAGITDILDGQIARRFNMITSFGKLADPVADKSMQVSALVLLTMQNKIPPVFLIIVIAKELFMIAGSVMLYKKEKFVVSANWYGKMSTVVFSVAIVLTLFNFPYNNIFILVAVLANLFSFFMYSMEYRKIKKPLN
ncbi:MAG: CDP-diacylglycerol--glycerol-3-phosphate 3-phosphatidyltransferase [Bacillota bacterium]|nr:CDP-diacylglycerol--glycerol-3-phosphate 3-phosphatidyltransferase [Bacillota bacterium]